MSDCPGYSPPDLMILSTHGVQTALSVSDNIALALQELITEEAIDLVLRGFCFVEMEAADAKKAIAGLNGKKVGGHELRVSVARPRKRGPKASRERPGSNPQPLHERTQRGGLGAHDFPHSGGSRQQPEEQGSSRSSSDFPHSGGGSRRHW